MTQLKQDLIKLLESERYYAEQELSRLVYHDTTLKYKDKLTAICDCIGNIAFFDTKIATVETVFKNEHDKSKEQKR